MSKNSLTNVPKKLVLVQLYSETNYVSIIAFSDSYSELEDIELSHPTYGSLCHKFFICNNYGHPYIQLIKDECLVNICKNVAEYLADGEYAMLNQSYFKSASWFEKANNFAWLGADILKNY